MGKNSNNYNNMVKKQRIHLLIMFLSSSDVEATFSKNRNSSTCPCAIQATVSLSKMQNYAKLEEQIASSSGVPRRILALHYWYDGEELVHQMTKRYTLTLQSQVGFTLDRSLHGEPSISRSKGPFSFETFRSLQSSQQLVGYTRLFLYVNFDPPCSMMLLSPHKIWQPTSQLGQEFSKRHAIKNDKFIN